VDDSRVAFAEAQIETGRADEGRKTLEEFLAGAGQDDRAAHARMLLGRARDMTGDRTGALDAYAAASRTMPPAKWNDEALVSYARLLTQGRRFDEARSLLEAFIKRAPAASAAEGALALGETFQAQGDSAAAIEYFMTAAYVAPDTTAGRRGLLAAGRAFAALKQRDAAGTVYRKLLAQSNVPADLANSARRGLAELPK